MDSEKQICAHCKKPKGEHVEIDGNLFCKGLFEIGDNIVFEPQKTSQTKSGELKEEVKE